MEILWRLRKGRTFLIATHDIDLITALESLGDTEDMDELQKAVTFVRMHREEGNINADIYSFREAYEAYRSLVGDLRGL